MSETQATKPPLCPWCGAPQVVPIVYGLLLGEAFERAERGEFAMGGCMVGGDSPLWQCQACQHEFGSFGALAERRLND